MSVFTIVEALCTSKPGSMVVIDEPELSLHPALQRKISDLFMKYSKDRQIVIFTHSPYFINWDALANGAELSRTVKESKPGHEFGDTKIYQLSEDLKKEIVKQYQTDKSNVHKFGLEAKETFFLEDNVILTEGQEDVFYYTRYFKEKCSNTKGSFFGWGTGGAENMGFIAEILKNLGFKKVFGILDGDKSNKSEEYNLKFKGAGYHFETIPAKDVHKGTDGLFEKPGIIKPKYENKMAEIVEVIEKYFK